MTSQWGPRVLDVLVAAVEDLMASPWIYLALFALSAIDAFFPVVPSESLLVTAGVFAAATGEPNLLGVIAAAAIGATAGDHISYLLGRALGSRLLARVPPGSRRRASFDWARVQLDKRGGVVLIVARYVPGGRTATTLTMGTLKYPLRTFTPFDLVAALSWGVYSALVGYIGGETFEDNPIYGVLLGLGIAITVAVGVELIRPRWAGWVRWARRQRWGRRAPL